VPVILAAIREEPLDAEAIRQAVGADSCGATVLMTGQVRDQHEGHSVDRLEYHAYLAMAEKEIGAIASETAGRWPDARVAAAHRLGDLAIGDISVAVAVAAPHREDAFSACRWCIDALKERLPVWKKEFGPDGAVWQEEQALLPPEESEAREQT
jgi:molybdopterin synthase catalytic subunit